MGSFIVYALLLTWTANQLYFFRFGLGSIKPQHDLFEAIALALELLFLLVPRDYSFNFLLLRLEKLMHDPLSSSFFILPSFTRLLIF